MNTRIAYIYDAATGLASRCVASDDYESDRALATAHCGVGEAALVTTMPGSLSSNSAVLERLTDDDMQAAVQRATGIDPPPKVRYALCGPLGTVFEVVETRRLDDPRLESHAAYAEAAAVEVSTLNAAKAVVATYPDLSALQPSFVTRAMREAHAIVYRAKVFGFEVDGASRAAPEVAAARAVSAPSFRVFESREAQVGDSIDADGALRRAVRQVRVAELPVTDERDLVL